MTGGGGAGSQRPDRRGHAVYLVPDAAVAGALVTLVRRDGRLVVARDLAGACGDADVLAAFTADWDFPSRRSATTR
ncbi:MAG TPA: hypothetical protein VNA20_09575 [Frankiaceae bacterium]|nr:hypothetical protein [Frankiaceae bacterium]